MPVPRDAKKMIRLFRVSIPAAVLGLFTTESALFFGCYIFAYYWHPDANSSAYLNENNGIARIGVIAIAFVAGAYLADLYGHLRVRSNVVLVSRIMALLGAALICEAAVGYAHPDWALPESVVIAGTTAALVVLSAWRMLYSTALATGVGAQKVLFLGRGPLGSLLVRQLRDRPELGIHPIGILDEEAGDLDLIPCLGRVADVTAIVGRLKPDRLIIDMAERRNRAPMDDLVKLRFEGLRIEEATTLYEEAFGRVCVDRIRPSQLILSTHRGPRHWTVKLQSLYSIVIASLALVAASPVLLLAAILIKLTSPGAVIYRQTRVGLNGRTFSLYKLRSMRCDAEASTGAVWAQKNDPRVTPLGRFLRKSRIDELPQLLNVLKGEMTIVGPRPERPEFVQELGRILPFYRHRYCVKPGITGWAQINHQYGDTLEHTRVKLEYDLYYIKNLSPALDAYIMFQTAKIMLLSRGAQ